MGQRDEVAQLAGVSPRTVSNVVSGSVKVTEQTRTRVLAAIDELGYRPSEIGRMLRSGRTGLLALALPQLDNPYFAELARVLIIAARPRGFSLLIEQTDGERDRELELLARADTKAIYDGIILSPLSLTDDDLSRTTGTERPVVLLGEERHPGFDHVHVDNLAAARQAVEHLLATGRKRIVAVGGVRNGHWTSRLRREGYQAAMADAGASAEVRYVDAFTRTDGAAATRELIDGGGPLPDAIFCFSDLLALGAIRALQEAGIGVPGQVAVVGFDDIEDGRFGRTSLTTISPDKAAIAEATLDALVRRLDGDTSAPQRVITPHRLIVRESSG